MLAGSIPARHTKNYFMKVEIVKHYEDTDEDCSSDYWDIEIFVDGKLAKQYGDYYHDKGDEKADGFLDALYFLGLIKQPDVTVKYIADRS